MTRKRKIIKITLCITIPILVIILLHISFKVWYFNFTEEMNWYHPARYKDWQKIPLGEYWEFSIPNEWVVTQNNNIIYITDKPKDEKDYTTYLIGMIGVRYHSEDFLSFLSELYDGDVNWFVRDYSGIGGMRYSHGVDYQKGFIYRLNGLDGKILMLNIITYSHRFYLEGENPSFPTMEIVLLIRDNEIVDDEMVDKIAVSFRCVVK